MKTTRNDGGATKSLGGVRHRRAQLASMAADQRATQAGATSPIAAIERMDPEGGPDGGFIQTLPTALLVMAARGEVDLNALARQELAQRGLDQRTGVWVGFERAAEIAKLLPVRTATGVTFVSIPEGK